MEILKTNSKCEGVLDGVYFIKSSASKLTLDEHDFDVVVSCLTVHEVIFGN
ncbi:hypothetical protein GNF68_14770 [Clostridium perfringens]|uniref:Uncharacterized protein n=1 Tax=Clostridium perfringens TaxID=1502 RepID=A0AAW9I5P0_CLOPF|nr:hypothetical protein [Clostridium perfringens]MDZ4910275.1 hypothetical protein [Clostridium perfringens]